jgi:cell division protein FtsL
MAIASRNARQPILLLMIFAIGCVISAIALVYTKHEARNLFVELEQITDERDALNIEWGQLQIEQSTYATHARIERVARDDLALKRPVAAEIYLIERQ